MYLLIRLRRGRSVQERFDNDVATSRCFSRLDPGWRELCHPVSGDIVDDGLGLDADAAEHLSARRRYLRVVRFDPNASPDLVPCHDVAHRILTHLVDRLTRHGCARSRPRFLRRPSVTLKQKLSTP